MSDIHVLAGSDGHYQIANHYAVPDALNDVGVNYRVALVNSGLSGSTVMDEGAGPGQIAAAELAQLQAGAVIEDAYSFPADSGGEGAAFLRAQLRERYVSRRATTLARLQSQLRYFGHTETES